MNSKNGHNWMIWVIVALVLLNASTVATIIYNRHKLSGSNETIISVRDNPEVGNEKYSGRYFRDKLNLNRNQMRRFSEFNPEFRQQAMGINIDLATIRKEMIAEMSAMDCDTSRLNSLSDSIGILHAKLKRYTYRYYIDLKDVCDAEQDVLLEQLFENMFTDDTAIVSPGRAWRGGQH